MDSSCAVPSASYSFILPSPRPSPQQRALPMATTALPPINTSTVALPSPLLSPPRSPVSPLAQFFAEMLQWIWFAPATEGTPEEKGGLARRVEPTARFLKFCDEVLTTTQVSHSVVLLALLFTSRLKRKNSISGSSGSEYRLAVTALMLSNKVLDDNTYTAHTWSTVSSLELQPLVAGEAEFLKGLDWSLHVTKRDFDAWLRLLEGHVAARALRLGKVASPPVGLFPSSRKIMGTRRVQAAQAEAALQGLGIDGASTGLLKVPSGSDDEDAAGRRVRRKVDAHTVSTNSTPVHTFATTFTLPAPSSAPRPQHPYSAIPVYAEFNQAPFSALPSQGPHVSPTSVAHTARRNAASRAVSASNQGAPLQGVKRYRGDEGRPSTSGSYAPLALTAPQFFPIAQPGQMSRSYSAGPTAIPSGSAIRPLSAATPVYLHPSHSSHHVPNFPLPGFAGSSPLSSRPPSSSSSASGHYPPQFGAVMPAPAPLAHYPTPPSSYLQSYPPHPLQPAPVHPHHGSAGGFQSLADGFSPQYDPEQHRRMQAGAVSLGYYSLAAGHGLGHLRQTQPPPSVLAPPPPSLYYLPQPVSASSTFPYAPHHPSTLSTVSSLSSGTAPVHHGVEAYPYGSTYSYANAGVPGVAWRGAASTSVGREYV